MNSHRLSAWKLSKLALLSYIAIAQNLRELSVGMISTPTFLSI